MTITAAPATGAIPALVNPGGGSAEKVFDALRADRRFAPEEVKPDAIAARVRELVADGATRIAICGGDGTVAAAAAELIRSSVELAVIPGGTLNHFAKDHGIPTDHAEAATLAASGRATSIDLATVNGHVFLNTSSVGAYVVFVRAREKLERWLPYRVASLIALIRILARLPRFHVSLEAEGTKRRERVCLVFIGVGERALQAPELGGRAEDGRRGLHVIVVRGSTRARLFALALAAVVRGVHAKVEALDAYLVDRCTIDLPGDSSRIATDGELVSQPTPLEYRLERDSLRLVTPGALER